MRADRRPVTLSGLPPDYLRIGSSIGEAAPTTARAWPILLQDSLLEVLEIASFGISDRAARRCSRSSSRSRR